MEVPERLPERLPQGDDAVVKRDKTVRYMLDPDHPDGGAKARRFREALGYRRGDFERLREDLRVAASSGVVVGCRPARPAGLTWTVDLQITGPNGRTVPSARCGTRWCQARRRACHRHGSIAEV